MPSPSLPPALTLAVALSASALTAPAAALAQSTPDLFVRDVSYSPALVSTGGTLRVRAQAGLAAGSFAGNVGIQVWLSPDTTLDATDARQFDGVLFVSTATSTFDQDVTVGVRTAGAYYVFVALNPGMSPTETSTTNNQAFAAVPLDIPGADLQVDDFDVRTSPPLPVDDVVFVGTRLEVTTTIGNSSPDVGASGFSYQLVLYNPLLGVIRGTRQSTSGGPITLSPGQSTIQTDVLVVPAASLSEDLQVAVFVNQSGAVLETSLTNNSAAWPVTFQVLAPVPELAAEIVAAPPLAEAGSRLSVTRRLSNLGPAAATADYRYALTPTAAPSAAIILGRSPLTVTLAPDSSALDTDTMDVPSGIAPGLYRVELQIDPDQRLQELTRDNNRSVSDVLEVFPAEIVIETSTLAPGYVGRSYAQPLSARGGVSSLSWSLRSGTLPPGLQLDSAQSRLSGTPTEAGRFELELRAESGGAFADRRFELLVADTDEPLAIDSEDLGAVRVGVPVPAGLRLRARGGFPPYTWTLRSAPVLGLELRADGTLEGTPTTPGLFTLGVELRDADGARATGPVDLRVLSPEQVVRVTTSELPAARLGVPYCEPEPVVLEASAGLGALRWTAEAGLPPGMSLEEDGRLCGTPTRVGVFEFTVRVDDAGSQLFDTALLRLDVEPGDECDFVTQALPDAEVGAPYGMPPSSATEGGVTLIAAQSCRAPTRFELLTGAGELPPGISLSPDGRLYGVVSTEQGAPWAFAVQLTDEIGQEALRPFSIALTQTLTSPEPEGGCRCARPVSEAFGGRWPPGSSFLLLALLGFGAVSTRSRRSGSR